MKHSFVCPPNDRFPFLDTQESYAYCTYITFSISTAVNLYTIYCIIYRSTKDMAIYRWYLLAHQIIAYLADTFVSIFLHPIVIAPFYMIKLGGIASSLIHCRHMIALSVYPICMSLYTMFLMVIFRYFVAKGYNNITPRCFKYFLIIALILASPAGAIYEEFCYDPDQLELIKKNYTCAVLSLENETNVCAYSAETITYFLAIPTFANTVILVGAFSCMIFLSYRAINIRVLSPQLKHLQKMYMLQIVLQFVMPTAFFAVPLSTIFIRGAENQTVFDSIFVLISLYSTIDGLVLIAMNKSFHNWLSRPKKRKGTVAIIVSRVSQSEKPKFNETTSQRRPHSAISDAQINFT